MIDAPVELQDMIRQRVQTPVAKVMVQTATADGSRAATQTLLGNVLSYTITRQEDPSSDTCSLTFADDTADMMSTNPNGKFSKLFQPGPVDNKFIVYLGLEGCVFPDRPYFIKHDRLILQKFTGFVETDANAHKEFTINKTLSLIDLTKQFRAQVNDTYPHPLYGDQTLPYFDPTYNLTPQDTDANGMASQWACDGKMFTENKLVPQYGTSHIDFAVYVDTTGGNAPASIPTTLVYNNNLRTGEIQFTTRIPANSVVSVAGNPTYMAPEVMIRKLLLELGHWSPNFLSLDYSGVWLPQYLGEGKTLWECLKHIAAMTSPRFIPWQMWEDENGYLRFYESRVDGPPVKQYLEGHNIITSGYEFTARQLRTVVRADGTVLTSDGSDQPVVSISYDVQNIDKYGQTEPLTINQQTTQNVRHLSATQAISYLNMLTASTLAQVSRPALTCRAEIWPDLTLQPGDKIAIRDTRIGMDRQYIIKETVESGGARVHKEELVLEEFYDTINYMIGIPAGVQGATDAQSQSAATPPPTLSIIGAIRAGTGLGQYPFKDGQYVTTPNNDQVTPVWDAHDTSGMHFDVYLNSLPQNNFTYPNNGQQFNYAHLPPAYNWVASFDSAQNANVFYGVAPAGSNIPTGTRVYVGPDSVFYQFTHAPPIHGTDNTIWTPPGNTAANGVGETPTYASKPVTVYLWQWWYLNLDSNFGTGKFYRPVQRIQKANDGAPISIGTAGGKWVYNTWGGAPGPNNDSGYYGNVVVGSDDYALQPPGFIGANILGDGVNVGVGFGLPALTGITYANYQKFSKGHYCVFACNSAGQRQYMRIPFYLAL